MLKIILEVCLKIAPQYFNLILNNILKLYNEIHNQKMDYLKHIANCIFNCRQCNVF